jgi:ribosomal protein S18 acetylase RimI-like enzyme
MDLFVDQEALRHVRPEEFRKLTEAATAAASGADIPTVDQVADNRRVAAMSVETCLAAAADPHRHLVVAMVDGVFAGFMIATIHGEDDRELDWIMVHPDFHGRGAAGPLMAAGIDWLGQDRAQWLNVIGDNPRAIAFYRKYGFAIDPTVRSDHAVPRVIMRRPGIGGA